MAPQPAGRIEPEAREQQGQALSRYVQSRPGQQPGAGHGLGERRAGGDLDGERERRIPYLRARHKHVDKAYAIGLVTAEPAAGVQHQRCVLATNEFRQGDRKTESGMEAECGEVSPEPDFRAGDPEVTGKGESEPAASR